MSHAFAFLAWFAALELLCGVLVGTTQSTELLSGLGAAVLGAVLADVVRARGLLVRVAWLAFGTVVIACCSR